MYIQEGKHKHRIIEALHLLKWVNNVSRLTNGCLAEQIDRVCFTLIECMGACCIAVASLEKRIKEACTRKISMFVYFGLSLQHVTFSLEFCSISLTYLMRVEQHEQHYAM